MLSTEIPSELLSRVREHARRDDIKLKRIVEVALRMYLEDLKPKKW